MQVHDLPHLKLLTTHRDAMISHLVQPIGSEATAKSHTRRLFEKLAATNRAQLAIAAFRAGLVE